MRSTTIKGHTYPFGRGDRVTFVDANNYVRHGLCIDFVIDDKTEEVRVRVDEGNGKGEIWPYAERVGVEFVPFSSMETLPVSEWNALWPPFQY